MSERAMRRNVVKWLKPLHAVAVENPACPGTPDINFVEGWLELKQVGRWPVGAATPVLLPHFTPQQRIWLLQRWNAGGSAWLLLQVEREWLLFQGDTAAKIVGKTNQATLCGLARKRWDDRGAPRIEEELKLCLHRTS